MIGDELRKARLAAGLTQEDVALEANVDRSYISELEHDKKSPTVLMLFRLCRVIQVRPSELIRRVEEQGLTS